MKAVVLAGGFGTRLRPMTYGCPKPMLPVQGKPFMEYLMNFLKDRGITEAILCLHYMADRFIEYFGDGSRYGLRIRYSVEETPMGTAGAIRNIEDFLNDTFLVLNGDTYLDLDLQDMFRFHRSRKALGTIALSKMKEPGRYGGVSVAWDWRIIGLYEKTPAQKGYINAGAYIFEHDILDCIPRNGKVSLEKDVLPSILSKKMIYGFLTRAYFIDIGIPKDYYRFQTEVAQGILR